MLAASLCAAAAPRAAAQTGDIVFGGWSSRSRDVGGRPSGLGGAYVAVADDGRSAVINPAGIALVPDVEAALGFGELWVSLATSLRGETVPISGQPANAGQARPCPPGPRPRPWALAFFGQQTLTRESRVEVVGGPGRLEDGVLAADREQVGIAVARGLTHWLNLGLAVNWRHLRMDAATSLRTADDVELSRVVVEGDANKARALVGTLATFGPPRSPTRFRIGLAYERDLSAWNIGRRELDVTAGTAAAQPATVRIEEPPLLSAGAAWRINDAWLFTGQLDYIWYEDVLSTLHTNQVAEADAFEIQDGFEPRFAIEHTRPSPIGGYLKVRAGVRRETSGRLHYTGTDLARTQAFPDVGPAFRGSAGVSLLAEFYARAARIDVDLSQVVVARTSSLSAAGTRRFSFNITVRM